MARDPTASTLSGVPFTFAHPAAAVPLARVLKRRGAFSALVIGSVAPDLAFVLPIGLKRFESHDLAGLLWFCLPVGLLGYLWFHTLARTPLLWLMPESIRSRVEPGPSRRFGLPDISWLWVAVSLLLGSLSHIAWDSLTHRGGFLVESFEVMRRPLAQPWGWNFAPYKILQYVSGVAGLLLLALWYRRWVRRTPARPAPAQPFASLWRRAIWMIGIASIVVGSAIRAIPHKRPSAPWSVWIPITAPRVAIAFVGSSVVAAVLYSIAWRIAHRRRDPL